jgi:hypothetical protein
MLILEDWIVDRQRREAIHLPSGDWVPLALLYRQARIDGEIIPKCLFRVPEPSDDEIRQKEPDAWESCACEEWDFSQVEREEREEWSVLDSNQ